MSPSELGKKCAGGVTFSSLGHQITLKVFSWENEDALGSLGPKCHLEHPSASLLAAWGLPKGPGKWPHALEQQQKNG